MKAGEFSIGFQTRAFGFCSRLSALSRPGNSREPVWKSGGRINRSLKTPIKAGGEGGIRTPVWTFGKPRKVRFYWDF